MAFSTDLKNELSRREIVEKDSAISELSAFIRTNGTIVFSNFAFIIRFETTNNSIIRRIFKLFKFLYSYDGKIIVSKISNLRKNNVYKIVIEDEEISKKFLEADIEKATKNKIIQLPSTSSANAKFSLQGLVSRWQVVKNFVV